MDDCPLCSGDRQPREGQRSPGHDRACPVGIAAGSTARGPRPSRPARLEPVTPWYDGHRLATEADGRAERRAAWERAWASR